MIKMEWYCCSYTTNNNYEHRNQFIRINSGTKIPKNYQSTNSQNNGNWFDITIYDWKFCPYLIKVIARSSFAFEAKKANGFTNFFTELKPIWSTSLNQDYFFAKFAISYYSQSFIPLNNLLYSLLALFGVIPLPLLALWNLLNWFCGKDEFRSLNSNVGLNPPPCLFMLFMFWLNLDNPPW